MSYAFEATIESALRAWNISPDRSQLGRMLAHYDTMIEANRTMNLTRIVDPVEAAIKHYADSLSVLGLIERERWSVASALDVGTGAGFPAVPLAIMRPGWSVTAIDATGKKIDFLRRAAEAASLDNLEVVHAHSDHWLAHRRFDLVLVRAVASLADAVQSAHRFAAAAGALVAYKTASMDVAEREAAAALVARPPYDAWTAVDDYAYALRLGDETLDRVLCAFRRAPAAGRSRNAR